MTKAARAAQFAGAGFEQRAAIGDAGQGVRARQPLGLCEEPRVLERDGRLGSDGRQHLLVPRIERILTLVVSHGDDADDSVPSQHRHAQVGTQLAARRDAERASRRHQVTRQQQWRPRADDVLGQAVGQAPARPRDAPPFHRVDRE